MLTGKSKEKFDKAIRAKEWKMSAQKRYTSNAINEINKIEGLKENAAIINAINVLIAHRLKLDEL